MSDENAAVPQVSAIICTRNRGDKIAAAVSSVLSCDHPSFDLTIIDQSTDDLTRATRWRPSPTLGCGTCTAPSPACRAPTTTACASRRARSSSSPTTTAWSSRTGSRTSSRRSRPSPTATCCTGSVVAAGADKDDVLLTPALDLEAPERLAKGEGYKVWGMGADFGARRRLFDRAGYFDEMLGGGGPLWSSQDYDLAYRTYKSGGVILLRPEVFVRHDGRREDEDWPKLLLAYGSGDGAFYMKHVRCLDPRATWLFTKQFGVTAAKVVAKTILRRGDRDRYYLRGMVRGARASFKYGVDRRTRLYVER